MRQRTIHWQSRPLPLIWLLEGKMLFTISSSRSGTHNTTGRRQGQAGGVHEGGIDKLHEDDREEEKRTPSFLRRRSMAPIRYLVHRMNSRPASQPARPSGGIAGEQQTTTIEYSIACRRTHFAEQTSRPADPPRAELNPPTEHATPPQRQLNWARVSSAIDRPTERVHLQLYNKITSSLK